MDDQVWEAYRPEIERLYLKEKVTLEELVRIMWVEYKFKKTPNEYQSRFRKWNVRKRYGREIWEYIDRQTKKREGRNTDVFIDGELQTPSRVRREIGRQVYQSTIDRFRSVASNSDDAESLSDMLSVTNSISNNVSHLFPVLHREIVRALNSNLADFIGLRKAYQDYTSSQAREGQVPIVAEYDMEQLLRMTMYLISNKLSFNTQSESFDRQNCIAEEDRLLLKLLEVSDKSRTRIFERLLATAQPSAHAILERLFQSAIRLQELKAIEMMLKAGISPDLPVVSFKSGKALMISPLEFAADLENRKAALEMTRLLLSFKANINKFKWKPTLQIALEAMGIELESSHWFPVARSAETENLELLCLLSKSSPHMETRLRRFGKSGPTVTALGLAVSLGQLQAAKLLIDHGANIFATQRTYLDSDCPVFETDVLGLAAKEGKIAMMHMLLEASVHGRDQSAPLSYGLIESLILAVTFGQEAAAKILLDAGVAVQHADSFLMARYANQTTLVERALTQQNLELYYTLTSAGAVPNLPAQRDCFSFQLFRSIKQNDLLDAIDLLSLKAPSNDVYDDFPDSVLGTAIAQGNCVLIKLLTIPGTTAEELRIPCIPNMETAYCLEALGLLQSILVNNGQMLLTCAILRAKEDGLIEYLLSRGVDQQEMRLGPLPTFDHWLDNLELPECRTPLEAALTRRNMALAQTLIHRGARVTENELNAIVWQAVTTDNDTMVRQLLTMFSTPFQAPTAVGMAVLWGRTELVRALLEFGIDPTGLVYITDPPDEGEEITNQNAGWWHLAAEEVAPSVLQVAASKSDRSILQLLLVSANWSQEDKSRALTASIFWRNFDLVSDLLAVEASVNEGMLETAALSDKVNTEMLPLQLAVNAGNIDMVKLLLQKGARINQLEAGVGGKTALQTAAKNGNLELLALLLTSGADVNHPPATHMGATALQFAATEGRLEIVCLLLDHGANVNASGSQTFGRTALEGAAERGHIDTLQVILSNGAQIDGLGRVQYVRSVKLAESNGHFATARLLRESGGWTEADRTRYDYERFDEEEHLGPCLHGPME
ncbi:ankyrin repeat-containing domain protein [Penicillium cataractarum]|uniref:Ankyrin repeat-containing domain protein n=1 Tax=Penicillium cataractarum TaxID=2100454 RepID=A0A9W9UZQ5_9EURO|nr:ankyrin repeat-containing domain protein [Penicillium cataractarum]KAJ5363503.1 ankyrin repeat-containing domain protein [Penicillium cataractarum]